MPAHDTIDLSPEIAAFLKAKAAIVAEQGHGWVVVADQTVQGVFADFEPAAHFALARFSDRPFLIRSTKEEAIQIPLMVLDVAPRS